MSNTEVTTKEPTPIVTAPTTTRVKDPRRVAQGKRLAEISKAAKAAKKKRLLEESGRSTSHEGGGGDFLLSYPILLGTIGAVVGIGGLYLAYKDSIWRRGCGGVGKTAAVVELRQEDTEKSEKNGGGGRKKSPAVLEGFD